MKFYKTAIVCSFSALAFLCTSCGLSNNDENSSETVTTSETERYIATTQTARHVVDENTADEDLEGYITTTSDTENRDLENPVPDEPDPDIIATTTTTYYTIPATSSNKKSKSTAKTTKKSKTTSETIFIKNKLHKPLESEMLKRKTKYKIVSDTTYLNLRFGPSKNYSVQLKIPDGLNIYGTARTKDNLGNFWIYVNYKGTSGWVMEELLKK